MPELKQFTKQLQIKSISPGDTTPEMMEKINRFALKELKAEDVYVRKFLMAHNLIDRDNERFPEIMLDMFARTMPGKSFLSGHNRSELPFGKWFDAATEEMSPEQFTALTNEECRLPEGMSMVKVLWTWQYMLNKPYNEKIMDNIDAGICNHCSIGFAAAGCNPIRKDPNGPALYWEYTTPGEALEGSLVWLGAQHGATAQKALHRAPHQEEGESTMKKLLAMLGGILGKSFADDTTEEQAIDAVKAALTAKEAEVRAELKTAVDDGKAYRKSLVDETCKFGSLIDEIPTDAEAQKKEADFLATLPIDRLKGLREKYETRAREKFPTHAVFTGKDQGNREEADQGGKEKAAEKTGKKDFTSPAHNELFGTIGK